jgi:hypothetical protein
MRATSIGANEDQAGRAMTNIALPAAFHVELDTRLIAAVQTQAGARCHRSANLLHSYYLCADVYKAKMRKGDLDASRVARQRFQESENRLREFLCSYFGRVSPDLACVA